MSDPGKGSGRPRPPYLRVWMTRHPPPPAPYVKVWIRHSALEGGKAGKMTRELLHDTSEKKGTR